jgi:hypothetical protein
MAHPENVSGSQKAIGKIIQIPFKKIFLITSGALVGLGIVLGLFGWYLSQPALRALKQEQAFELDLTLAFFQLLQDDYFTYQEQANDLDSELEPEIDITTSYVNSNYQVFFNNSALAAYLTGNYTSNSYIYSNTPGNYTSDIFIQFFTDTPIRVREIEEPICSRLKSLTGGDRCQDYFVNAQSFIELIQDLNAINPPTDNAEAIELSVVNQRFETIRTDLQSSLDQILNEVIDNRTSPDAFYALGIIAGMLGIVLLIPTGIIYTADYIQYLRHFDQRISEAQSEAIREAQQSLSLGESPWKNASRILDAYYQRNLGQITKIYNTSIRVMVAGFMLIIFSIALGIFFAAFEDQDEYQTRMLQILEKETSISQISPEQLQVLLERPDGNAATIISFVGVGAGIITNFIGATFLFLYQTTIKQASEYTESLAKTNTVGISMEILSTLITEETRQRETLSEQAVDQAQDLDKKVIETKIEISKLLIAQLQNLSNKDD